MLRGLLIWSHRYITISPLMHSSKLFNFSIYADETCIILAVEKNKHYEVMKTELASTVDWFSSDKLM